MSVQRGVAGAAFVLIAAAGSGPVFGAAATRTQNQQAAAMGQIPTCAAKLGSISIRNGDDPRGWAQSNLAAPEKLLRVMVQKSGCFDIVDRGAGMNATLAEQNLGGGGQLQRGSNVGLGQIRAADYVLVAEVQAQNSNAGGSGLFGALGSVIPGGAGAVIGGIRVTKLEANTVLSLSNVRTTETVAVQDGYYLKNDIGWGAGGGIFAAGGLGGAVGGGYENTDIGRVVTLAFIDAYTKLVTGLGGLTPGAAQQAPIRTYAAIGEVAMRATPAASGALVRTLPAGSVVYPTGNKSELWWEIADQNDNVGWVLNTRLEPAK